jgi:mRNA-degrading endonuclease RelE of RelBE toxin-antitoxin system/PHD/YefM family antitoxin component YafN of YafNO toxin-antitoxin module
MSWKVDLKDAVLDDLRWFGRKKGRLILNAALKILETDPLAETRNLKTLRKNPFAERELRLSGNYRILFNVDQGKQLVTIMAVGEWARSAAMRCSSKERSSLLIMKIVPLSEVKANLSHYGKLCHKEPIIVTVNGHPQFQLVPLDEDDDLVDRLLEFNPRFREMLEERLQEKTVSAQAAKKRL